MFFPPTILSEFESGFEFAYAVHDTMVWLHRLLHDDLVHQSISWRNGVQVICVCSQIKEDSRYRFAVYYREIF